MTHPRTTLLATLALTLALALAALTRSTPVEASTGLPLDPAWAMAATWDDGRAEVSTYRVERPFYGEPCSGEAIFIVVKEPWDAQEQVKSDHVTGLEVLKLNRLEEIDTAYYPYRFACSSFLLRRDPRLLDKLASTSQEWCGTTYQALRRRPDGSHVHEWRSYFGSEADREAAMPPEPLPVLALDALPVQLRALDLEGGRDSTGRLGKAMLLGSILSNHAVRPEPVEVEVRAFREGENWRVELVASGGESVARLWFSSDRSRLLQRAELPGGIRYVLESSERRAYWPH